MQNNYKIVENQLWKFNTCYGPKNPCYITSTNQIARTFNLLLHIPYKDTYLQFSTESIQV